MLERLLEQYGYWIVCLGSLLEADATLIASTFLAHRGYLDFTLVVVICAAGTVCVSQAWFWLARKQGRDTLDRMIEKHRRYERLRRWVTSNGFTFVFFCRFLWGLRLAIPAACGATGMNPRLFFLADVAGAALWAAVIGTAGYAISRFLVRLWHDIRPYEDVIVLSLVGVVSLVVFWRGRDARREIAALSKAETLGFAAVSHIGRQARHGHSILGLHIDEPVCEYTPEHAVKSR